MKKASLLMLQETKVQDGDFPFHEFSNMGYKYLFGQNHIMALLSLQK